MKGYSPQTMESFTLDVRTSNVSAIKMAVLLESMGVDNYYFMLKLIDKDLQGVDPYDEDNLTDELKLKIFLECSKNRWYFYREVYRVVENGASTGIGGGSPFIFNRGNLAYLWAMEMNLCTYLIMPRQTGKTWAAIADYTWTYHFVRGSTLLHFNKNQKDSNDNIRRIQQSIQMLPKWMQHSNIDNLEGAEKRTVRNNEKTVRNTIGSCIEAMASAGNESKADAIARGRTSSKIWYDEMAFIFFNETIYDAATPAYEKARELAEMNGAPYAISITTTPGDLATPHGAWAYKMMSDSVIFHEEMYGWSAKKLNNRVNHPQDKVPFLFIQYSYLQLGETEEWYLERYQKMHNPIRARREYLLEWMNTNGNSPFDPDDVDTIGEISRQRDLSVQTVRINKYYEMRVYDEYHGRKPVIIGCDVSTGRGRDSSTMVVVHPETLLPLAIFKSNMIDSKPFRKVIQTVVTRMYPNCILAIENNAIGSQLISEILDSPIGRCLYKERKKKTKEYGTNPITSKKRKVDDIVYGFETSSTTRPQMTEMLESIVHNSPNHLGFQELYEEIRFLELRNGRIDHGPATHDDVVMAYMGALWVVRYGTGLKGRGIYYTIDDGMDDLEEIRRDTTTAMRTAARILKDRGRVKTEEEQAEEELIDFMTREHHVQSSEDLAHAERMEYFKEIDRIQGILVDEDEPEFHVSQETENLLLRNYHALMNMDPYADDPVQNLLNIPLASRGGPDSGGSFMDAYRW
ncbi:MAG: hypothetical protein NC489_08260 [Ruminococcus flavefaciens]|nr:hypothetical protein [Ruminococcus flavefaciens]